jgi:hypothetical protein
VWATITGLNDPMNAVRRFYLVPDRRQQVARSPRVEGVHDGHV